MTSDAAANNRRIDNLTGVRAYAALWVVVLHISLWLPGMRGVLAHSRVIGTLAMRGNLGVDVFFVLSGLVLAMVYAEDLPEYFSGAWYRQFVARRFAKIYPLHLLTFLLAAAIIVPARHFGHHPLFSDRQDTWWSALCHLLMLNACGLIPTGGWNIPSWSVGAEWFAYTVLFAPMVFLLRGVRVLWLLAMAVAAWMGLFVFIVELRSYNPDHLLSGAGIVRITPEFLAGYALYRWLHTRSTRHGDVWMACGVAALVLICLGPLAGYGFVLLAILAILRGAHAGGPWTNRAFGNRVAVKMGEVSYSIYLTHFFVIVAASALMRRVVGTSRLLGVAITGVVALIAAVGTGMVSFRYVEEPLRRWLVRAFGAERGNPEAVGGGQAPNDAADTEVAAAIS